MSCERSAARRRDRESGQSLVEVTLLAPWIFFLFLGIVNAGFFGYAMVAVENAARLAALYASPSTGETTVAEDTCRHVKNELSMLPNIGVAYSGSCNSAPLTVTYSTVGPSLSADGEDAVRVTVSYQSIPLFPIPGLTGRLNITRSVEARLEL